MSLLMDLRFMAACGLAMLHCIYKPRSFLQNTFTAALVLWIAYGHNNLAYIAFVVFGNAFLLAARLPYVNEYVFIALNLIVLYGYKVFGHMLEPRISGTFDISGFLMVLTIKMSYAARDLDEAEDHLRNRRFRAMLQRGTRNAAAIHRRLKSKAPYTPFKTVALAIEYLLFMPGLLSGPTPTLLEFVKCDRYAPAPFPRKPFLLTLLFLGIYGGFRSTPFKRWILDSNTPYVLRIVYLYLFNVVMRLKFHYIWNFSHCCYLLYNFTDQLNIDYFKVEAAESVREITVNWNKFVSRWLREMFFIPLRPKSFVLAIAVSNLFTAMLHGINICYFIFAFFYSSLNSLITWSNKYIPFRILRQIQASLFVTYFSTPFFLLDAKELLRIWKAVFFYGNIYCGVLLVLFLITKSWNWLCRCFRKKSKSD